MALVTTIGMRFLQVWYVTLAGGTESERFLHKNQAAGLSSLGVPGVPWHTRILADQLTLFQPGGGGTDYAHLITTGTPGFSDLPTALMYVVLRPAY